MSLPFGPPVSGISPLVKIGRYIFLFLGIKKGLVGQKYYTKRAERDREVAAEQKVKRDIRIKEEKRLNAIYEEKQLKKLEAGTFFDDL